MAANAAKATLQKEGSSDQNTVIIIDSSQDDQKGGFSEGVHLSSVTPNAAKTTYQNEGSTDQNTVIIIDSSQDDQNEGFSEDVDVSNVTPVFIEYEHIEGQSQDGESCESGKKSAKTPSTGASGMDQGQEENIG